jgi:uncharacterized membrane protein
MCRILLPMVFLCALPLAACDRDAPPAGAERAGNGAMPAPTVPTAPGDDAAAALPAEFVVSTNEPFWQARVEGGEVVLSGPDVDGRHFAVSAAEVAGGARQVHGSDDAGTISVTLLPGPCEDSMSGAVFPQSAELTIDGIGPIQGCARPAGTHPPQPGP